MAGRKNGQPSSPGSSIFLPPRRESACRSHLKGSQSQLQREADAQARAVGQEVEDDVVNSKQRDEEKS